MIKLIASDMDGTLLNDEEKKELKDKEKLEKAGLVCSGVSPDGNLVEIVELEIYLKQ